MEKLADIGALCAFVAVAETGSFAKGAHKIGLTRSAAGKAVMRLEELLGARLFHRTTRRIGLTAEGALFLSKATQILSDLKMPKRSSIKPAQNPVGFYELQQLKRMDAR